MNDATDTWPELPLDDWQDTYATLHRWVQMVGKIRTKLTAPVNHWWHATLYVSPRGLTTTTIPYEGRLFEMEFDFIEHELAIRTSDGGSATIELAPRSVADFYGELIRNSQSSCCHTTRFARSTTRARRSWSSPGAPMSRRQTSLVGIVRRTSARRIDARRAGLSGRVASVPAVAVAGRRAGDEPATFPLLEP